MLTNGQAIDMMTAINRIMQSSEPRSTRFNYAMIRNRKLIEQLIATCNEALNENVDPNFTAWQSECNRLRSVYAYKDAEGNMVNLQDGLPAVADDKLSDYNKACDDLLRENAEWNAAVQVRAKALADLRGADAKLELYPVKLDDLPQTLPAGDVEALYPLIVD